MKKTVLVVAFLVLPLLAFAQQAIPTAEKASDGLSQQDVQVLTEAVSTLTQSFAPQPAASGQQNVQASPVPQKNMADVADKVVDLGSRAIAQAAGTVQKVAPEVWRIMIRQQYAKAAGLLTVPFGMFLLGLFAWFRTGTLRERLSSKENPLASDAEAWAIVGGYVGPLLGMGIFGLWFLNRLADSVMYLFNPEYYAFRDLLIMILNKGQVF